MKIEIIGKDAEVATQELLNFEGIEGSYETLEETPKEGVVVLTTIATIVAIAGGAIAIADKLYEWYQKYKKGQSGKSIEKVMIVTDDGRRFLLKDVTLEQLKELLED